jgi:hypothetical protein
MNYGSYAPLISKLPREESNVDEIYYKTFMYNKEKMMSIYLQRIKTFTYFIYFTLLKKPISFLSNYIYAHFDTYLYIIFYVKKSNHIRVQYPTASCRVINYFKFKMTI